MDFSEINFVRTCDKEIAYTYTLQAPAGGVPVYAISSSSEISQCYSPMDSFWVILALGLLGAWIGYKTACFITNR